MRTTNRLRLTRILLLASVAIAVQGCFLLPNQSPIALIDARDLTGRAPFRVSFNAYDSQDPDGEIERCRWSFGDGNSDTGEFVSHTFRTVGTYTVTLTVWDDDGASDSDSVSVTVLEGPQLSDFHITDVRWEPSTCYLFPFWWPCVYVYVTVESTSPYAANVVIEATARNASGAYLGSNELLWNNTCDIPPSETFVVDGKILFVEGPTESVAGVEARIAGIEACN